MIFITAALDYLQMMVFIQIFLFLRVTIILFYVRAVLPLPIAPAFSLAIDD